LFRFVKRGAGRAVRPRLARHSAAPVEQCLLERRARAYREIDESLGEARVALIALRQQAEAREQRLAKRRLRQFG